MGADGDGDGSGQPVAAFGDVGYAEQVINAMKPGGPLGDSDCGEQPLGRKQKAIRRTLMAWVSAATSQRLSKGWGRRGCQCVERTTGEPEGARACR